MLQLLQRWKTIVPLEKVSITDFFREFSFRPVETSCLRIYCTTDFNASSVSRGLDFLTTSQPGWNQSSWQDKDKTWPRKSSPISREQNITSNLLLPWGMISWDQLAHRKRKQMLAKIKKTSPDCKQNNEESRELCISVWILRCIEEEITCYRVSFVRSHEPDLVFRRSQVFVAQGLMTKTHCKEV